MNTFYNQQIFYINYLFYLCNAITIKELKLMARPICETPILYGEDAKKFLDEMKNSKPASDEEKKRIRASYEKIKKLATFIM